MIIIYFGFGPCYRRWIHPETAPLIVSNLHFPLTFSVCTHSDSNPYHAGNMEFTEQNEAKISEISEILTAISRITEPIPGMFVLNWMHFSLWFQIWSWTFTFRHFFTNFVSCVTCRLHSPAAWNYSTIPFWPSVSVYLFFWYVSPLDFTGSWFLPMINI